jgi:hypothetical protein
MQIDKSFCNQIIFMKDISLKQLFYYKINNSNVYMMN